MRATGAPVRSSAPLGDLGGQDARERPVGGLDDGDLAARGAGRGGELRADPSGADDHDGVLLTEDRPQPCGVVEGAQQMDAAHTLRARELDRFGAGGDDQDVVRDGARRGVQFVRRGPHAGHVAAQLQLDVERLEVDVEGGVLGLAEQHRLGQRRPVVGLVGFGSDQGDRAGEALFPQGHGGLHTGHARTDDDDAALGPPVRLLSLLLAHLSTLST
jgi:hypothetical protein